MNILILDGQGGKIGQQLIELITARSGFAEAGHTLIALGTNSIATAAMLRAGAHAGATGENPVVVNSADAGFILGPVGILAANALLGEVTPAMAAAIGASPAVKILIPSSRCNIQIAGTENKPLTEYVRTAVDILFAALQL